MFSSEGEKLQFSWKNFATEFILWYNMKKLKTFGG